MSNKNAIISSPLGDLELVFDDNSLIQLHFVCQSSEKDRQCVSKTADMARSQLDQYFKNANFKFNLPLKLVGTDFQKKVWSALQKIPAGETRTYGNLAKKLKTCPRAVGNACRANPIPIIIPCHRVIGKNGLTGYAGRRSGQVFDIKQQLLQHELDCL